MKLFHKALLVICFVVAFPMIVFAQETTTHVVSLGGGYSITVPVSLRVRRISDGEFNFTDDTLAVSVITPIRLQALTINFPTSSNVVDVLISLANPFNGVQLERSDVEKMIYGTRPLASAVTTNSQGQQELLVAITMSDGTFGYLSFTPTSGDIASIRPSLDRIITTFVSSGSTPPSNGTSGTSNGTSNGSASVAVDCTVSTAHANTARLRVGPGTNRGAISFLPINVAVTVTGRIVLSNGSVWYQLDKSEAAPGGTTAAQLWVSAEDVVASGDCDHVGETSAPPVIPIAVAPPPATNPGSSPAPGGATSTGGLLPVAGNWVFNISPVVNASCTGTENAPIPATEIYDSLTENYALRHINNDSFEYGGSIFTRYPGSNNFSGSFLLDNDNVQVSLFLDSTTAMHGQLIDNITYDGGTCNATTEFVTNHT